MCCNDELSSSFTNRFRTTRYMKVKKMGMIEILRRIWLFSAIKIKSSESGSTQPTQLIIAAHNWEDGQIFVKQNKDFYLF